MRINLDNISHIVVRFNGEPIPYCFEADNINGYVRTYIVENGIVIRDASGIPREQLLYGKVTFYNISDVTEEIHEINS